MTTPGGEPYRGQPDQPWQPYPHAPVDPQTPLNYPEYPYPEQPPMPPYGYPAPPIYPSSYDPYRPYPPPTNGLAVASLITSVAGIVLGIPLAVFCYVGWLIPVVGAVMGAVALGQIKRTGQQGRGLAIAGVAIGTGTAALLLLFLVMLFAAIARIPTFLT